MPHGAFIVPFAGFMICALPSLWLLGRVARWAASHHPGDWEEVSARTLFAPNAAYKFIRSGRHYDLADDDLHAQGQ